MKGFVLFLIMLSACSSYSQVDSGETKYLVITGERFPGTSIPIRDFKVSLEDLKKIPAWDPASGLDCPVSRDQAKKLAEEFYRTKIAEKQRKPVTTLSLTKWDPSKGTKIGYPETASRWFYYVGFGYLDTVSQRRVWYIVSLSGKVYEAHKSQKK